MRILFRTHLQLLEGWENYLLISFNNCICFNTSLPNNSASGPVLALLDKIHHKEKKLRDSRYRKEEGSDKSCPCRVICKAARQQDSGALTFNHIPFKNQCLVPLHTVALHKASQITAEDCSFILKTVYRCNPVGCQGKQNHYRTSFGFLRVYMTSPRLQHWRNTAPATERIVQTNLSEQLGHAALIWVMANPL